MEKHKRYLWVQYGYPDTDNAPVLDTADTEEEAKTENSNGKAPWYRFEVSDSPKREETGLLVNPSGPFFY